MFSFLKQWVPLFQSSPTPPLDRMRLAPNDHPDNPLMIQFFTWNTLHDDMTWWKHFQTEVPHLVEMGFTQVWLPPMNKAAAPGRQGGRGYDAYDLWDLGEFNQKGMVETRWGSKEELVQACKIAKQYKLDILIDAVLNHKHGGEATERVSALPVHSDNRLKAAGKRREIETWTVFSYPERDDKHSKFKWNQAHFTGVDFDQQTDSRGIYRLLGPGHKGWSPNVDTELGNYDFLMGNDIDHRHPEVRKDLLNWGTWVLETTNGGGFRLDAIKHIDRKFLLEFLRTVKARTRNDRLFSVSEYWSGDINRLLPYVNFFKGETSFFDVPLHMNFCQASRRRDRYDLRRILQDTLVQRRPRDAVTFVDNHEYHGEQINNIPDITVFNASKVEGQSLESWVEPDFKLQAYAIILLRGVGHPCIFYGDLYPNKECYNENVARNLKRLIQARKNFAYGNLEDYFHDRNCIGFVRRGDAKHPGCAVVLSNKEDGSGTYVHHIRMNVGKENAGSTYGSFMTQHGRVEIDSEGWGTFTCFANYVQIWIKLEE